MGSQAGLSHMLRCIEVRLKCTREMIDLGFGLASENTCLLILMNILKLVIVKN